jgi:hypothetical protein
MKCMWEEDVGQLYVAHVTHVSVYFATIEKRFYEQSETRLVSMSNLVFHFGSV